MLVVKSAESVFWYVHIYAHTGMLLCIYMRNEIVNQQAQRISKYINEHINKEVNRFAGKGSINYSIN